MDSSSTPGRACPACGSADYQFRSRKRIAGEDARGPGEVETKYRCEACGHEWRVRAPKPGA